MNKKILSLTIAFIVVLSLALSGCSQGNKKFDTADISENVTNDLSADFTNTENILFSMADVMPMSAEGSVSKTLTATVLPATAANKAVDWTCEWADGTVTSNVSDYVTVTPASDGSTTATVTCYQSFTGNIIITVITRESGYSASCVVNFIGIPTDITITGNISPKDGAYRVGIGQSHQFTVALSNPFNSVGNQFNNITCGIAGVGSVVLGYMEHYNSSGKDLWYDEKDTTVLLDSLKDNFITASYSSGKLTISTLKSIESYYESSKRLDSGRTKGYTNKFRSFVDDCYFKVWIKENTSGVIKEYIVRFDDSLVTGIIIGSGEMSF